MDSKVTAPNPSLLLALAERLRTATGQLDDETLGRLICAIKGWYFGSVSIWIGDDGSDEFGLHANDCAEWFIEYRSCCPDVSIDAALALVREKLPEVSVELVYNPHADAWVEIHSPIVFDAIGKSSGATLPLAILAALLAVLIEQAPTDVLKAVAT